ncbi:MAG: GNAT family N-acetyltransferase [Alphaproteobacteria bacterium]|nr:GNAT family N-acetyltransferase [Alphaproteobacteria bacterium]
MSVLRQTSPTFCGAAAANGNVQGSSVCVQEHLVQAIDLQDVLKADSQDPVNLDVLGHLIAAQASLHHQQYRGTKERLRRLLTNSGNTVRGFVLYAEGMGPAGFAIYYPMISGEGKRISYCEDFFVVESCRGHGIINQIFHELAKRTLEEGSEYLEWSTDARNDAVLKCNEKAGAKHPNIVTLSATHLLSAHDESGGRDPLSSIWQQVGGNFSTGGEVVPNLRTYLLEARHVDHTKPLGIDSNIIRQTGDMPFKGFITFENGRPDPVAIVLGSLHLSTFKLEKGIYLENPVIAEGVDQRAVVLSVVDKMSQYTRKNPLGHAKWHVSEKNEQMLHLLKEELGMPVDTMDGSSASELLLFRLTNGSLRKIAANEPDRVLRINPSASIGARNHLVR